MTYDNSKIKRQIIAMNKSCGLISIRLATVCIITSLEKYSPAEQATMTFKQIQAWWSIIIWFLRDKTSIHNLILLRNKLYYSDYICGLQYQTEWYWIIISRVSLPTVDCILAKLVFYMFDKLICHNDLENASDELK